MKLENIVKKIQGFGGTALNQARGTYDNYTKTLQDVARTTTAPVRGVTETVGEFTYSPQTLPQDWRYRAKLLADKYQRKNLIQIPYTDEPSVLDKMWNKASEKGRMGFQAALQLDDRTQSPSADYYRFNYQAPPEDTKGAELKKAMLDNPALFPGARKYLESLSVSADPQGHEHGYAGAFYSGPQVEEHIKYDPRNPGGFDEEVIAHEGFHAFSDVFGKKELGNFVADVNKAYQANPRYFEPVMQWIKGYKENPQHEGYFDRDPLQEANELYAQIGAIYGPEMSNHPVLGKYYQKVFDKNAQASQPYPEEIIHYEDGSSGPLLPRQREDRKRGFRRGTRVK